MTAECWLDYASQALHEYILQPSVTCTLYQLCTAPLPSVMEIIQLCAETDLNCTTLKLYSGSSSMYKLLLLTNVVTKVVFSYMSVRQFVHRGLHVIITHDTLNLTVQPPPRHETWNTPQSCPLDMQPLGPPLLTSGGHHWRYVQTYSLHLPWSDIWRWPLKHVRFAGGRHPSYRNASLFLQNTDSLVYRSRFRRTWFVSFKLIAN